MTFALIAILVFFGAIIFAAANPDTIAAAIDRWLSYTDKED